jgi:hypothetical protein
VKLIRKRLTYANVMSSIAVFLLLGGTTAIAAKKIGTGQLKAGAVTTGKIKKGAVKKGKIANGAVSTAKLANDAVTSEKILNGAVTRDDIAVAKFIPRAYAFVDNNGAVVAAFTDGIPNATQPGTGIYCFDLAFAPIHAQATGQSDGEGNDLASVNITGPDGNLANCPAPNDLEVEMWDTGGNNPTNEEFYVVVW